MSVNIVSSYAIAQEFKKSRHFRQSLGVVATVEKNGQRVFNDRDQFSKFYNQSYRTTIYAQGNVGDIRFYVDHMIHDINFAVYIGDTYEEFINSFDTVINLFNRIFCLFLDRSKSIKSTRVIYSIFALGLFNLLAPFRHNRGISKSIL